MTLVAPSVLSLNYTDTASQIRELNASGAEWIHFDVMDGNFVPNISFGPDILKAFCASSDLYKDVHLMVKDPAFYADVFMDAGADLVTFHYEAMNSVEEMIALAAHIHERGKKAGISIKPKTDVKELEALLPYFDLFLIMSVEPGFGGQKFQEQAVTKIAAFKTMLKEKNIEALIEVDGGINDTTCVPCVEAGVDVLVAGSYFFKRNMKEAYLSLCK